jgi:hypothetical protein
MSRIDKRLILNSILITEKINAFLRAMAVKIVIIMSTNQCTYSYRITDDSKLLSDIITC